ncbi:MAG TPA: GNAT family N-acetyltransferase [Gemmataceae bacterium]|nr:GNAT family N-acetyltransferase [Gemmataceae bacterium]
MSDLSPASPRRPPLAVRTELRPGDLGAVVRLHGTAYARECGFDVTFEAYVAGPLARFVLSASPRERLWLAERTGDLVGCVAVVAASAEAAQLRWFLVDPSARRAGLGTALLAGAVAFAREAAYRSVTLWTVSALGAAARLYRAAGFRLAEERPGRRWGVDVVEQRYELALPAPGEEPQPWP